MKKKNRNLILVGVFAGILAYLGFNKYKDVKKLYNIDVVPGKNPFRLVSFTKDIVQCLVNLVIDNPSRISINLETVGVEMYYKGEFLGRLLPIAMVLNPTGKTLLSLPLQVQTVKVLRMAKDVIFQKKIEILFKCYLTLRVFNNQVTIPYEFAVDIKDQLMSYINVN